MKLLLAASLYPPEARGPSVFAGQLVEHLQAHGWEVAVVKFKDVRRYPPVLRHALYFLNLLRKGRKADVVLALDPISTGVPALVASWLLWAPFVLRIGGDYAWEQGMQRWKVSGTLDDFQVQYKKRLHPILRLTAFLQSVVARSAAKVVAPSKYLAGVARGWGVKPDKASVIYTVVPGASVLTRGEARAKLSVGEEPLLFSLGALVPWKGFPTLLKAAAALKHKHPALKLVVAGEGPDRAALERLAGEAGLGKGIFVGDIPNAQVLEYLRAADAFVLNTGYEGLSHVLVEAMHAGAAIVTTPVGGNIELVEDGKTGLLVPYDDQGALEAALDDVLSHKDRAASLGAEAKLFVGKNFAAELSMRQWEQLLTRV